MSTVERAIYSRHLFIDAIQVLGFFLFTDNLMYEINFTVINLCSCVKECMGVSECHKLVNGHIPCCQKCLLLLKVNTLISMCNLLLFSHKVFIRII